jgi:hypothetical protein
MSCGRWANRDSGICPPCLIQMMEWCCRYYVADGVRMYSQETWQLVMGDQGRQQVAAHISQVIGQDAAQRALAG